MDYHYFITSFDTWVCEKDLAVGIERMKRSSSVAHIGYIWLVPTSTDSTYEIRQYAPMVAGSIKIGAFRISKSGIADVDEDVADEIEYVYTRILDGDPVMIDQATVEKYV